MTSFDGTVEAQKLISAIARTGERFGTEHLISILVGEETDAIRRFRHNRAEDFRGRQGAFEERVASLLRQIYAAGLVNLELSEYGRWTITERGDRVLKGQERIELRSDVLLTAARAPAASRALSRRMAVVPGDDPLLVALKVLRTRLAKEEGVPAYVIFSDRCLIDMAAKRPTHRAMHSGRCTASGRRSSSAMRRLFSRCYGAGCSIRRAAADPRCAAMRPPSALRRAVGPRSCPCDFHPSSRAMGAARHGVDRALDADAVLEVDDSAGSPRIRPMSSRHSMIFRSLKPSPWPGAGMNLS